jgi:hypothetical protein
LSIFAPTSTESAYFSNLSSLFQIICSIVYLLIIYDIALHLLLAIFFLFFIQEQTSFQG